MQDKVPENITKMSFEEALKELEGIVRRLESGESALEQSIEDYVRGDVLRQHCEKKLGDARMKVEKIIRKPDGSVDVEDFSSETAAK
jgi:exodeoxyribonuclease VII small subunit